MFQRLSMLCAFVFVLSAVLLQAQPNLFVLPGAGSSGTVSEAFSSGTATVNNPVPITNFRTFTAGAGSFALIPNLSGSNVFVVASSPVNSIVSTDETFLPSTLVSDLSPVPTQATITPDGRLLAVAAGNLHLFNAVSGAELVAGGLTQGVGLTTIGVAVSLDSTSIFALGTNTAGAAQLNSISTSSYTISGTLALTESATAVSVGPNGLVYVSMPSQILVVDPRTLKPTFNGQMVVTGTPGPLVFTPDGQYAVSTDQSGNLLLVSLATNTVTAPSIGISQIHSLQVIGTDTVLALTSGGLVYPITVSPLNISPQLAPLDVGARGVIAITTSNDVPTTAHNSVLGAYLVSENSIYQYVPASENISSPFPVGSNVSPGAIVYAIPAVTTAQSAPTSLLAYGNNQSILPGATSEPLVVQVLDANNVPVSGASVQFQAGSGATLFATSSLTGSNGCALAYVTASDTTGVVTVTATIVGSLVTPATFSVNVTTSAEGAGGPTLTIISGQGELMEASTNTDLGPPFAPLEVLATDASGNPIPNLAVTFSVPPSQGTLVANNTYQSVQTVNTNTAGVATVNFLTTTPPPNDDLGYLQTTITASANNAKSVTFYNTAYPQGQSPSIYPLPAAAGTPYPLVGGEGTILVGAVRIQVVSAAGKEIPNVSLLLSDGNLNPSIYPTATCNGSGGIVLSDASGVANCDVLFGPRIGTGSFVITVGYTEASFASTDFTVTPGPPGAVQITQGNNQTGVPGQTLPLALRIHVTDSAGNSVSGAVVTWQVGGTGTVTLSDVITTTDSLGDASALATAGSTGGAATVTATAGSASATFNLTVNIPTAGLQKVSGDQQTTTIGTAFPLPLIVKAVDSSGNPVAGAQVNFQVTAGAATLSSASAITSATGQASTTVTAGATPGAITVSATSSTLSVTFTLTANPPGPQNITIVNGASFDPNTGISPGGIATVRGVGILPGVTGVISAPITDGQYPTTFSGVTITFNGTPAPIYYVEDTNGNDQVTVQVPFEVQPGSAVALEVSVANEGSPATVPITVKPLAPGVFTSSYNGKNYAVAVRPDGSQVSPNNPAQRGETIQLYITGLGQATPAIATNTAGVADQTIVSPLIVGLNNGGVPLVSVVYGPGLIGIYIVVMQVPEDTQTGPYQPIGIVAYDPQKNAYFAQPTYIPIQ